jgi:hypothetical protein
MQYNQISSHVDFITYKLAIMSPQRYFKSHLYEKYKVCHNCAKIASNAQFVQERGSLLANFEISFSGSSDTNHDSLL